MRANPGGGIAPEDVVGRDKLVKRLWATLQQQSLVLVAERRMGKTTVLKKMEAESPESMVVCYRDTESVSSPVEFVERVAQDVERHLNAAQNTARRAKALLDSWGGGQILGVKFPQRAAEHWKALLEEVLGDLADHTREKAILFWDELPLMLQKIARATDETVAMDLLDTLRGLRQTYPALRMVYTGSIGLHHVLSALRGRGVSTSPVNDMQTLEVPPLEGLDARYLAAELIRGEDLVGEEIEETATVIADLVDGVPFYIHHVAAAMANRGEPATPSRAEQIVAELLVDAQDPWDLQHYRLRLSDYYDERAVVALAVLDELAVTPDTVTFDDLHGRLRMSLPPGQPAAQGILDGDKETLRSLVKLMQRDHYLRQQPHDGTYGFRFNLIKRWWALDRGLV